MVPTISYTQLLKALADDAHYWRRGNRNLNVTMCGLLFARPQSELASKEIFPEVNYFNQRLGARFHLFTAGCFPRRTPTSRYPDRREISDQYDWLYSDEAFDSLRREVEGATVWKYNDGVELLLFNATKNRSSGAASLDFHSAVAIDLQEFRRLRPSETVAALIGRLARYCERYEGNDPTWGFSDEEGLEAGKSGLWNLFVGLLPEGLRNDAGAARLFVTKNLSKRTSFEGDERHL